MNRPAAVVCLTLCALALSGRSLGAEPDQPVDYATQIKPILARNCVYCHGPDERESGLRLDTAALAIGGGDRGASVVPGKSEESVLYHVLVGQGDVGRMPLGDDPLSDDEIALIKRWIDEGAKAPDDEVAEAKAGTSDHWAFQPIRRPAEPPVKTPGWVRNPIDAFILARLEKEGLKPSPEADRITLARRLSLDLRGLPPSVAEIDEFLTDSRPDAYEQLVDRMLASPHYGERWGRHWLDVARYADSHGFTIDGARSIWKYRDWVIDAFNRDLPFDRFVIEQLAGDLLEEEVGSQKSEVRGQRSEVRRQEAEDESLGRLIATGFHRNTLVNQEGGTDQEQFRVEAVNDRVETTGAAFLGLTLGCAQCHQHKYDPISQREYYQFFAIFNNCDEPNIPVPSGEQAGRLKRLDTEIAAAEQPLREYDAEFLKGLPDWEAQFAAHAGDDSDSLWTPLEAVELRSEKGSVLTQQGDKSIYVDFSIPPNDAFTIVADAPLERITAIRLEALTHSSLPNMGPGRAENGSFVLSEFEARGQRPEVRGQRSGGGDQESGDRRQKAGGRGQEAGDSGEGQWSVIPLARAVADHAQEGYPVEHAIDGKRDTGWAIGVRRGSLNVNREAVFFPAEPLVAPGERGASAPCSDRTGDEPEADDQGADAPRSPGERRLAITLRHDHNVPSYLLGVFRLSVSGAPAELLAVPESIRAIVAVPAEKRTRQQREQLEAAFLETAPDRKPLAERVTALKKQREQLVAEIPTTMVLRERKSPRQTHIHIRGDFLRKGAPVTGGVPAALPPLPEGVESPTRLDLARWLVDPVNPLTSRVTVNRYWQRFFGTGIVRTENDFGLQADPPTHPELLDWLAAEFMQGRGSEVRDQRSEVRNQEAGERQESVGTTAQSDLVADHSPLTTHHSPSTTDNGPRTTDQRAWSIKRIHRLIVTSATYRQSSAVRPELRERDPDNRLLARQSRLRLEAEIIRDLSLASSGLLSPKLGGPGVYPPQPEGIYVLTQVKKPWPESKGPDRYRRGLYTYFWRSSPYPLMPTFDAPEANTTCTRRNRSNTPLQALTLANDRSFIEIAKGLAARVLEEAPAYDDGRLRHAFRLCLSREPTEAEQTRLTEFLEKQRERFAADEPQAKSAAPAAWPQDMPITEAAAWTAVARVLLNLDEFITRE